MKRVVQTLQEWHENGKLPIDAFKTAAKASRDSDDVEQYLKGLKENGEQGDHLTMMGASVAYGVDIHYFAAGVDDSERGGFHSLNVPRDPSSLQQNSPILLGHEGNGNGQG